MERTQVRFIHLLCIVHAATAENVVSMFAGELHTCACSGLGAVKCWGWNAYGQLGLGDVDNRGLGGMGDALPSVDLGSGRKCVDIVGMQSHTCALLDDGGLKCWGRNNY
eukprot:831087-Amphidinium_carterae.1